MNPLKLLFVALIMAVLAFAGVEAKTPNPYKVLGVQRDATEDEIRKAFKKRSLKFHPDRSQDPRAKEKFEMVVNAYELLKDDDRRRIYDQTGEDNPRKFRNNVEGQPQGNPFGSGGFGFPGGGFPGGFGINIEDLLRGMGGAGGAAGGARAGGSRQFSFSFGGGAGQGMRFEF